MTDDLDDLKSAMDAVTPRPDATRRADNIALAMENFDRHQESADPVRPTPANRIWTGVISMMQTLTTKGGLTATTALVAAAFLVTPAGQDIWRNATPPAPALVQEVAVTEETDEMRARAPEETVVASPTVTDQVMADVDAEVAAPAPRAAAPKRQDDAFAGVAALGENEVAPQGGMTLQNLQTVDRAAVAPSPVPAPAIVPEANTESFPDADPNPLKITTEEPVSTFSIDVDTASYGVVRSSLNQGYLPPADAVRIEEMVNYFPYDYAPPEAGGAPFQPTVSTMTTPWNPDTQLVHIALQGELPVIADRPPLNLVFLIDTSGSMSDRDKLPLLRQSFLMMLDELRPEDEVAIVTYAGSAGLALPPTRAENRAAIAAALMMLSSGGSTNGQGGLEQAYAIAEQMKDEGDVSRVLLATDGDFNVGLSDPSALTDFIADKRDTGTFLSVLGFGRGNLDDTTMQALAQNGNGTAAYIDTLSEARKVLVDQLTGALFTIASDVKVQVEWNPAQIAEYRLIGYETRALNREDFNNDTVDAGELGAGHSVTAIYEVTPVGSPAILNDPLRYAATDTPAGSDELGFLKLRYKTPGAADSQLLTTPITGDASAGTEAQFAAAIAGFGQLLKDDTYLGDWTYADAIALAAASRGADDFGYRGEALQLMRLAESLDR